MGNIISASLDNLVGYEDCDPSITGPSFFSNLKVNLIPPPLPRRITYIIVLFIWIIMTISVWVLQDKMGTRVSFALTFVPIVTFLIGSLVDSMSSFKSSVTGTKGYISNWFTPKGKSRGGKCGATTTTPKKPSKIWKGKWGFIYGLSPYFGYFLYLFIKYWLLRVRIA